MLPTKCWFIFGYLVSEEKVFFRNNQKQELPMVATFVNGLARNEHLYTGPSIDASYQVSVHLAKRFQRRFFLNRPMRNKNCLWRPCLLTDPDEMCNRYREPSIDVSYQVSVHLAKRCQRKMFFLYRPIRKKYCLWRPCLLTDRDEMCKQRSTKHYTENKGSSNTISTKHQGWIQVLRNTNK